MQRFRLNHPKFPLFLNAVSQEALVEGSVIEITVTTPEGKNYCSNIKLKQPDLERLVCLNSLEKPKLKGFTHVISGKQAIET